ncbi:hypothetical protein TWF718_007944 [Orbilia javanica]|uniref:Uncharacterized protein n=1 Tax=Orbilia javanica TaxID=47235 RepID=A0AAN8N096_9PEZI
MNEFILHFSLDNHILGIQSTDSLCIAQYVNKTANMVYDHRSVRPVNPKEEFELSAKNVFKLSDVYNVQVVQYLKDTETIEARSASRTINFWQIITFKDWKLEDPQAAEPGQLSNPSISFGFESVIDPPYDLRIVVQASKEVPGNQTKIANIHLDSTTHLPGVLVPITPEPKYFLFWHPSVTDSELVHIPPEEKGYVIEFSRDNPQPMSVRYGYATKDEPQPKELPSWWREAVTV